MSSMHFSAKDIYFLYQAAYCKSKYTPVKAPYVTDRTRENCDTLKASFVHMKQCEECVKEFIIKLN